MCGQADVNGLTLHRRPVFYANETPPDVMMKCSRIRNQRPVNDVDFEGMRSAPNIVGAGQRGKLLLRACRRSRETSPRSAHGARNFHKFRYELAHHFSFRKKLIGGLLVWSIFVGMAPGQLSVVPDYSFDSKTSATSISLPFDSRHYYVLWHSADLRHFEPVDVVYAKSIFQNAPLEHAVPGGKQGYYRVEQVALAYGRDLDSDGVDDWFELRYPQYFDAMDGDDILPSSDGKLLIKSHDEFDALARRDNVPGALGVREVKFLVVDVDKKDPLLYFLNSTRHPYHDCFTSSVLRRDTSNFNNETYFIQKNRKYLAGSLVAHDRSTLDGEATRIYAVSFWPTDSVPFQYVELAYNLIIDQVRIDTESIYYFPTGQTQESAYERDLSSYLDSNVRRITAAELYGEQTFNALNTGIGYGRLKVAQSSETYSARDIVIFKTIPNDINLTAGVITEVPQTPLSHVNLRAQQNEIPNAFIENAAADPAIAPLIGEYVRYEVTADGHTMTRATQEEAEAHLEAIRPSKITSPPSDLSILEITPLEDIVFEDAIAFGAKAANVAELRIVLSDDMVPHGFAVPFYFYDAYMMHNGFYERAREILDQDAFQADPEKRRQALSAFREEIRAGEAPEWMLEALQEMHASFPEGTTLRCRSSTNNEDVEGFNGAGLYNSYTQHLDEGHIIKSMRQVWASLWTFRAFEERDFYRIDHFSVFMGVLVHPNFEDEKANGVAVTRNIFDPRFEGYYVNVQVGEDLVTNPEDESIPDEFLAWFFGGDLEIQYARNSNRVANGATVLSDSQIESLVDALKEAHNHFEDLYQLVDFALDVEFKITKDDKLVLKQARPWSWPNVPEAEDLACQ